jgi:hypothetical protein
LLLTLAFISLFIRHPAREIVTALLAVMLFPVPVAISVESNIFAPAPTRSAFAFKAVVLNRQRRIVPVNNPKYPLIVNAAVQSVKEPVADCPFPEPNPLVETEHLVKVPEGVSNPETVEQSVNIPEAIVPNENIPVDVQRLNVPLAVPDPNEFDPAMQSSNNPEAIEEDDPTPWKVPANADAPATHLRYVPAYSMAVRIPESFEPLKMQFSI